MKALILTFAAAVLALPATAQVMTSCDRWEARADNLAEPWEDMTRTFANGAVRIAVLDTVEPAAGAMHLMILSPPYAELGERQCRMISASGVGFSSISFDALTAAYDPQTGLGFDVPVRIFDAGTADFVGMGLGFTVNQASGVISAKLYPID